MTAPVPSERPLGCGSRKSLLERKASGYSRGIPAMLIDSCQARCCCQQVMIRQVGSPSCGLLRQ